MRNNDRRCSDRFHAFQIERDSPECAARVVHKVAAGYVVTLAGAPDQCLRRSGFQIENGDLRSIDVTIQGSNRKQHRVAVREEFRPEVIAFTARAIRAGQHGERATAHRDLQKTSGRSTGGSDDRVVVAPRCAAAWAIECRYVDRWSAGYGDLLEPGAGRPRFEKAYPPTVG